MRGCLPPAKTVLVVVAAAEFAMFVIAGKYDCTLPLHVPILGLIISFSLRKNLQLLSSGPGGGEKSVCDLQSMGWGGSCSGLDNNIWSRDPVLGSSATAAFDLDPAFSFLEDVPIGRGEGGMESSVQMFEIPPILPRCLYLGD